MTPTTAEVTLDQPIKRGEGEKAQEIAKLTLRKPDAGAMRGLGMLALLQMDAATVRKILPRIAMPHITDAEAQALDVADVCECATEIASFLVTRRNEAASPQT